MSTLNESPDSIILHEVFVDKFSINKDEISFRLRLHHSIYLWHKDLLKDIYKDPVNNYLILDLVFKGVKIKELIVSSDFNTSDRIAGINNDYDEENKTMSIGLEDDSNNYADITFSFDSFEWIYVEEKSAKEVKYLDR